MNIRMSAENLTKRYAVKGGRKVVFHAVRDANIFISPGESVGLLGDSGSGKTTLGMMLAGLLRPTGGTVLYQGRPLLYPYRGDTRREIQILFQHPELSFNPALPVGRSMSEPYRLYDPPYTKAKLLRDMERVGLYEEHLERLPSELSGGELQRLALTRLLVLRPAVTVLDEPTSMLDVISQAQIIALLREYQEQSGASFFLITHHRELARAVCGRIYTVENGIVREGECG